MLRQLARLTFPVESAGEGACAIAVYADAAHRIFPAAERGKKTKKDKKNNGPLNPQRILEHRTG